MSARVGYYLSSLVQTKGPNKSVMEDLPSWHLLSFLNQMCIAGKGLIFPPYNFLRVSCSFKLLLHMLQEGEGKDQYDTGTILFSSIGLATALR